MLALTENVLEPLWNRLQEPAHASANPADFLLLLSALDDGWQILEAARWTPGSAFASDLCLVTIFHPRALLTRTVSLRRSAEVDALLKNESITLINSQFGA
ncbi:MAG: hypothetical protein OHK0031_01560 [Anaerolineales bacterium]